MVRGDVRLDGECRDLGVPYDSVDISLVSMVILLRRFCRRSLYVTSLFSPILSYVQYLH